jgi:hypothetical protein
VAKGDGSFPDTAGLLAILLGTIDGRIDKLFDLSELPRKMMEIEKKYRLTTDKNNIDVAISKFFSRFGKFLEEGEVTVEKLITFVGVDQYFVANKNNDEFIFRYRVGANRPPQLTVKFQIKKGSNLVRGEINLDVKYEEPEKIRAFMAVICALGDSYQLFAVQQSGNIWIIKEPNGNLIEVVAYRVKEISSSSKTDCFVEIEPLNSKNIEQVVATIEKYEKALQLTDLVCEESIADIFRP